MAADPTTVQAVQTATHNLQDTLLAIGRAVLPYAVAVVGMSVSWRFASGFMKSASGSGGGGSLSYMTPSEEAYWAEEERIAMEGL
jgi:hypothetical protein